MMHKEPGLALRRQSLIRRCEAQRAQLIRHAGELHGLMTAVDGTVQLVQRIKQHPGLTLGAVAAVLMVVRPRRFAAAFSSVTAAMRTWNLVAPVVLTLRQRASGST